MRCGARCFVRAGLQNFSTGGAFRILEISMLRDNQGAPQRNHHEDAEQSAQHSNQHDAREFEVEAQDHDRRHRHANAEGDRFAR